MDNAPPSSSAALDRLPESPLRIIQLQPIADRMPSAGPLPAWVPEGRSDRGPVTAGAPRAARAARHAEGVPQTADRKGQRTRTRSVPGRAADPDRGAGWTGVPGTRKRAGMERPEVDPGWDGAAGGGSGLGRSGRRWIRAGMEPPEVDPGWDGAARGGSGLGWGGPR
ncbi:hypothetical protein GCM10023107_65520 [Actinoplanes octamycinicus]